MPSKNKNDVIHLFGNPAVVDCVTLPGVFLPIKQEPVDKNTAAAFLGFDELPTGCMREMYEKARPLFGCKPMPVYQDFSAILRE